MKIGKLNGLPGGCFMTKQSGLNSGCLSNHVVELIIQIGHVSAHSEKVKRLCWRHFFLTHAKCVTETGYLADKAGS